MNVIVSRSISIFDKLNDLLADAAAIFLVLISIAVCVNAIVREFGLYFMGLLDFARIGLVWIAFCGAAWLLRKNGHVKINALTDNLNRRVVALMDVVTYSINFVIFILFMWFSAKLVLYHFQIHFFIADSVYSLPKAPYEIIIPLGCALLVIELFRKIIIRWRDWKQTPVRR